jgi:hypothetical protein
MFKLQGATLHLGCLLNERVLSVLWSEKDVSVDFGFAMKKIDFCLLYKSKKYKLELSYESIWEIQLHSPLESRKKFLLIQVLLYLGNTSLCMLEHAFHDFTLLLLAYSYYFCCSLDFIFEDYSAST